MKNYTFYEKCKTREKAETLLKQINKEENLEIKNLIYPKYRKGKLNYYEILLTKNKKTKIDIDDLEKVDRQTWYAGQFYPETHEKGTMKTVRLHNYLLNFKPSKQTIDHINGNGLDNRKKF